MSKLRLTPCRIHTNRIKIVLVIYIIYVCIYIYIQDRWRVGPPPCLHRSFVVGVLLLVLSNCNSSDIGQLPVPIVALRNFDENNRTHIVVTVVVVEVVVLVVVVVVVVV